MTSTEIIYLTLLILLCPAVAIFLAFLVNRFLVVPILGKLAGRFPILLASRYLFSSQHRAAINFITLISVVGVTMVTYFLIIILSIFNGFQHYIENRYTDFDPDLRIVAAKGKSFAFNDSLLTQIRGTEGVDLALPVIDDRAMLTYFDKQSMAKVKGVTGEYLKVNDLRKAVYEGEFRFETDEGFPAAVLGGTVAYYINARISDRMHPMKLWAAGDAKDFFRDPESAVRVKELFASAYFRTETEYDESYLLVSFGFAQQLFDLGGRTSSIEVRVQDFDQADAIAETIQAKLGAQYKVETWYDMHATLFNVMKNEKFVAYLILTLMLLIAAVNIIGGLSMIIVDKTKDIGILRAMGSTSNQIRTAFLVEGLMVGLVGAVAGMVCAGVFSAVHLSVGVLKVNGGQSFQDMEFFPLRPELTDYIATFLTVLVISLLAGWFPSKKAAKLEIIGALRK